MKTLIISAALLFNFTAWAADSSLDDAISEKLSPLLSNYIGDSSVSIQAEHIFFLASDQQQTKTIPVFLSPIQLIKAEGLQDCEENASSMVCQMAEAIEQYIKAQNTTRGKINLNLKIFKKSKLVKEISNVEVLSF